MMDRIVFDAADGPTLEGEIRRPDGTPEAAAVICHAHPQHGGSKDHPVLWALRIDLARRGFVVLSFNFRGVMGSEGQFGGGEAEVEDVRAAVSRARQEVGSAAFVCGWSFGAHVALREALTDERVGALGLLGFPVEEAAGPPLPPLPSPEELAALERPVLFVSGEADQYSPEPALRRLAGLLPRASVRVVEGTDHYFGRREREAAAIVGTFATKALVGDEER
jgi:alpha/beta superfamily hydrolase